MSAYEPKGIFRVGFSKSEIESILAEAKRVFLEEEGSQIVSWSASGQQSTSQLALPAHHLILECVYALQLIDPENYPPDQDRTVVSFNENY